MDALSSSPPSMVGDSYPPSTPFPSVIAWQGTPNNALRERILAAARADPNAFLPSQHASTSQLPPPPKPIFRPRHSNSASTSSSSSSTSSLSKRPRHNSSSSFSSLRSTPSQIGSCSSLSSSSNSSFYSPATTSNHDSKRLRVGAVGKKVPAESTKRGGEEVESEDRWDLARLLSEVDARMLKQKQSSSSALPGRSSSSSARRSSTEPTLPSSSRVGGGGGRSTRDIAPPSTSSGQGMATRAGGKGKERMRSLPSLPFIGEVVGGGSSSSSSTEEIKTTKSAPPPFDDYLNLGGMNEPMDGILEDDGGVGKSLSGLKMKNPSTSPPHPHPPQQQPRPFRRTTSLQLQQPPPRTHLSNPPPLLRRTTSSPVPPPSPRKPRSAQTTTTAVFSPPPPLPLLHHRTAKALSPLKQLINSSNSQHPSSRSSSNSQYHQPQPSKPNPFQGGTRSSGPVTVGIPRRLASSLSKDPRRTFRPPFLKQPNPTTSLPQAQPSPPKQQETEKEKEGGGGNAPSSDGPRVDSDNSFDSFDALLLGESEDIEALLRVVDGV